jgi:hypothetical protein
MIEKVELKKTYAYRNFIDDEEERVDRRVGRCFVFNYFHDNKSGRFKNKVTPRDVFGRELLTEDSPEDANSLINLFAQMYIAYMTFGTIDPPTANLQKFRQSSRIGETLINWLDEYFMDEKNFGLVDKKTMHTAFMTDNRGMNSYSANKYNSPKRFKELIASYCELRGYIFNPEELYTDKTRKRIIKTDQATGKSVEMFFITPDTKEGEQISDTLASVQAEMKKEIEETIFPLNEEEEKLPF